MLIALARNPGVRDGIERRCQGAGLLMKLRHTGVFDFPAPVHLFDDQFGIHRHRDLIRAEPAGLLKPGDEAPVLGDIVSGHSDELPVLGQHGAVVGRPHHATEAGRAGVSPRAAVSLDDDSHSPGPRTRNRIAPHSEHRSTSSSDAAVMRAISPRSSSMRQPPQRPPISRPAPIPDDARCRS